MTTPSTTPRSPRSGDSEVVLMWVVARPERRNYLMHRAPEDGGSSWETRAVSALCGWSGFAGRVPEDDSVKDDQGYRYRRSKCPRCKAKEARGVARPAPPPIIVATCCEAPFAVMGEYPKGGLTVVCSRCKATIVEVRDGTA